MPLKQQAQHFHAFLLDPVLHLPVRSGKAGFGLERMDDLHDKVFG